MEKTIGKKLYELRKTAGLTQDSLAEILGVSPQAVSKWENDLACPDIMLLPQIANIYGISIDELFNSENFEGVKPDSNEPIVEDDYQPPKKKVNLNKMFLYVFVDSKYGDDVKVRVPLVVAREVLKAGKSISATFGVDLSDVNIEDIFKAVSEGFSGEVANVKSQNGDIVRVVVE